MGRYKTVRSIFDKGRKDGTILRKDNGTYYIKDFPEIEVFYEEEIKISGGEPMKIECRYQIYSMESGERPRDEQNCLVWNTKYGDVPLMAYWSQDEEVFFALHSISSFPLLVSHWMEIPDFDPDKS